MKLGEKIAILRKMKGWSQETLGFKLEKSSEKGYISRQSISSWENGTNEPVLNNIRELAEIFNVSFDVLLDESINLDDPSTRDAVAKKVNANNKSKAKSVTYYFGSPYAKRKDILNILLCLLSLAIGLYLSIGYTSNSILFAIGLTLSCTSLGLFLGLSISLFVPFFKKTGYAAGRMTYTTLYIKKHNDMHEMLYFSMQDITSMELGKHFKNYIGDVIVHFANNESYVIKKIFSPITLITSYKKIKEEDGEFEKV